MSRMHFLGRRGCPVTRIRLDRTSDLAEVTCRRCLRRAALDPVLGDTARSRLLQLAQEVQRD